MPKEMLMDEVRFYMKEIGKVDLITREQEVDLAKQIEKGKFAKKRLLEIETLVEEEKGKAKIPRKRKTKLKRIIRRLKKRIGCGKRAKKKLVKANLRLVVSVAKKYLKFIECGKRNLSFLDLIQGGNTGLMIAAARFEWQRGNKFSTCAIWWIRRHVQDVVFNKERKEKWKGRIILSLDAIIHSGSSRSSLHDVIKDARAPVSDENMDQASTSEMLKTALSLLDSSEQKVIAMKFGLFGETPANYKEIAAALSVKTEMVRRIVWRAMRKMQINKELKKFYDGHHGNDRQKV